MSTSRRRLVRNRRQQSHARTPNLQQPAAGRDYVKLPFAGASTFFLAQGRFEALPLDAERTEFFENWLLQRYRRGDPDDWQQGSRKLSFCKKYASDSSDPLRSIVRSGAHSARRLPIAAGLYRFTGTVHPSRHIPMSELTPRQREILKLIQEAVADSGMPPTRAEIAEAFGFKSPNAAEEHLRALQRKGVIDLIPGASRGIQLKDSLREQMGLPLIGRVAAGRPILAEEHIESHLQIDPKIFQPRAHYLLKVRGMSMKDIGILDGDLVAVHRTPDVRSRQVVVARLDNEVTVKRYKQEGKIVWLLPENDEFEPIRVDLKEQSLTIEGVVVGVLRQGKSKGMFQ